MHNYKRSSGDKLRLNARYHNHYGSVVAKNEVCVDGLKQRKQLVLLLLTVLDSLQSADAVRFLLNCSVYTTCFMMAIPILTSHTVVEQLLK